MTKRSEQVFSNQLEQWLKSKQRKTLATLIDAFEDRSFAIIFVLLMLLPALPIPTGGITHVLEVVVVLVALEMVIGRKTIWLPNRLRNIELGESIQGKIVPSLLKRVRWFEQRSRPSGVRIFNMPGTDRLIGLFVILFTVAAFVAPPFTGLDTLPAMGVVAIGLSIILKDIRLLFVGVVVGVVGSALVVALGAAAFEGLTHIF